MISRISGMGFKVKLFSEYFVGYPCDGLEVDSEKLRCL